MGFSVSPLTIGSVVLRPHGLVPNRMAAMDKDLQNELFGSDSDDDDNSDDENDGGRLVTKKKSKSQLSHSQRI